MAVVKNLMVRAGADFSAMTKETKKAQKSLTDLKKTTSTTSSGITKSLAETQKSTSGLMKGLIKTIAALGVGKVIKDAISSAMNVESSIGQIDRVMGQNAQTFKSWAATQASAYNMSKSEALKYGAVYSNLISGFAKDTGETLRYTEDLLKSSAVVASATGRSMEDVMDRIRSGLLGNTESIEDLGINVNVAMIQSTDAFKRFANGRSWQQIDYQTQQQIRLMAILEQSNKKYGDSLGNTTATSMQRFIAQLKNVQLSLGQAFLPILNAILPALTALASGLATAVSFVAQFIEYLFGKTKEANAQTQATNKQAAAVGNLGDNYKKAGKEAKGALASIDEITSLSSGADVGDDGVDVPGGGMVSGVDSLIPTSVTNQVATRAAEIAKALKEAFSNAFGDIGKTLSKFKDNTLVPMFKYIVNDFAKPIGKSIKENLLPVMEEVGKGYISIWNEMLKVTLDNWSNIWDGALKPGLELFKEVITGTLEIIKGLWDKHGQETLNNVIKTIQGIGDTFQKIWDNIINPILKPALETMKQLWNDHIKGLLEQVGEMVAKLINGALEIYNGFIKPIIDWLVVTLGPVIKFVFDGILSKFATVWGGIADIWKGATKTLTGIIDFVTGIFTRDWSKAWEGVKKIFGGVFDQLYGIVKFPLNLIIDAINTVIKGLNSLSIDVPEWVPDWAGGGQTWGVNIKPIQKLAKGGIVTSATYAMVGEDGTEAVMPLERNTGWIDLLASKIKTGMGNSESDQPAVFIFKIGETELGRATVNSLRSLQRQTGEIILNF